MKIQGSVEIRIIDSSTGNLKQLIKKNNLVPNATLISLLSWNSRNLFRNARISISTSQEEPSLFREQVPGIIATGTVPTGATSPTWNDGVDPPFLQIQNRIDLVGFTRTFWTVALTNRLSNNRENNATGAALAYVLLDTPCTQGPEDYLDIYYRIQFAYVDGQNLTRRARYDFGKAQAIDAIWTMSYLAASPCFTPIASGYDNLWIPSNRAIAYFDGTVTGWTTGKVVNSHFKFKYELNKDLQDYVGVIFNAMVQGKSLEKECAYSVSLFENRKAPFSNGFWHSSDAPGPFFDSSFRGRSLGRIFLEGSWNQLIPELYKINIITDGETGVATYTWSARKHLGFNGNSYVDKEVLPIYRNPNIAVNQNVHGWRDEDNDVLVFSQSQIVQYDQTGVTVLDLITGEFFTWDVNNGLTATDIRQCATDGVYVYAACRNSGLWVMDIISGVLENIDSAPCYGVDIGREGVAYAIFEGKLSCSVDWAIALNINYSGLTDNNWIKAKFLKVDPENTEDRIAIIVATTATTNRVIWYSAALETANTGYSGADIKPWPASLDVSDSGGIWATRVNFLTWNALSIRGFSSVGSIPSRILNHSLYGNDVYCKVSFSLNNLILFSRTINNAGQIINSYPGIPGSSFAVDLGGGIIVGDRFMRQLYNNDACWIDYGWDGAQWVQDFPGARITHSDPQVIINELEISFADKSSPDATGTSFAATEYFTQSLNWGLLKDNATRFNWVSQWYSKPAQLNSAAEAVIPDTPPHIIGLPALENPDFVRIETDVPQLHSFAIDSEEAVFIYTAGEDPGPGEISLDVDGTGILTFSEADAGKIFVAAPYAWVNN